jgi:hypothetical protein
MAVFDEMSGGDGRDDTDDFIANLRALIARSSLGTPEAVALREQTPRWLVREIARRCGPLVLHGGDA